MNNSPDKRSVPYTSSAAEHQKSSFQAVLISSKNMSNLSNKFGPVIMALRESLT